MKRRLVVMTLCGGLLGTGLLAAAPQSQADRCYPGGPSSGYRGGYVRMRRYPCAPVVVRRYARPYRHCDDDDGGPSIGTILLGAGAAYGAYRVYEDIRDRRRSQDDDDDDGK